MGFVFICFSLFLFSLYFVFVIYDLLLRHFRHLNGSFCQLAVPRSVCSELFHPPISTVHHENEVQAL